MKLYTYRPWPPLTYQQMPDYLEEMEKNGLRFHHMTGFLSVAAFEKIPRAERALPGFSTAYCWDYLDSSDINEIENYLDICQGSGWDIVWQFGKHKIFRSEAARRPAPLWSPKEYGSLLWKRGTRPQIFNGLALMLLWLLFIWIMCNAFFSFAITPRSGQIFILLSNLFFILTLIGFFWSGIENMRDAALYKRNGEAEADWKQDFGGGKPPRALMAYVILSFLTMVCGVGSTVFLLLVTLQFYTSGILGSLLIVLFYPFQFWNDYTGVSFARRSLDDKHHHMRGTMGKGRYLTFAISGIVMAAALGGIYYGTEVAPPQLRTSNLYCAEIYTDQRLDVVSNMYFRVRQEEDVEKVLDGVFKREYILRPEQPISYEDRGQLSEEPEVQELTSLLKEKTWDAVYDDNMFYVVIRRDNEIWCVLRSDATSFLKETNF